MKSQMLYLQCLLNDLGRLCRTCTRRDHKTIVSRFEDEGFSFLTITLSNFCKDFEKSLDRGFVAHDTFLGFKRRGGLPVFLRGFLELIFDSNSGRLLDVPCHDAIFAIRQVTLAFGKVNLECAPKRVRRAYAKYVECDMDVRESDRRLDPLLREEFNRASLLLWSNAFSSADNRLYNEELRPSHSSGAVAERLSSNEKWRLSDWTERLDSVLPTEELLCPSWSLSQERLQLLNIREPGDEIPLRIIDVPKTLKTPRIIAIEPAAHMFVQQGVLRILQEELYSDKVGHFIRWDSQLPNQEKALEGSLTGSLATLDLSEASDRVSNQLVRDMLCRHPHLFKVVDACRSRKADVPGHGVVRLAKFASMGSALCFPFEAMVFLTIVLVGIARELRRPVDRHLINEMLGLVRIYGDDIIVPVEYVHSVIGALESFGLKVNADKSFWNGKFRESCGKEYYDGHDVSVARVRSVFPTRRKDVTEIISTVSLRNQVYKLGLWETAGFLDSLLERLIPFPIVEESSPVLGRHSFGFSERRVIWDVNHHVPLVRGCVVSSRSPEDPLDDYGALLKCLTSLSLRGNGDLPTTAVEHLERSGRPRSVSIKAGWHPPY